MVIAVHAETQKIHLFSCCSCGVGCIDKNITLGPAYNEFGYKHKAVTSRYLRIKIIDSNVEKFGYREHSLIITNKKY